MKRRAFTLVELLVVITIIGILVSLSSVAVFKALEAAHRSKIKVEIAQLEMALGAYSQKHGEFPPSDLTVANKATIVRHLARAFPRCNADTEANALIAMNLSPAQALVYWLRGLGNNVTAPITDTAHVSIPNFDFSEERLSGSPPVYHAPNCKDTPYVYFNYKSYWDHNNAPFSAGSAGICRPYMNDPSKAGSIPVSQYDDNRNSKLDPSEYRHLFVNSNSFQIVCSGLDGLFGTGGKSMTFAGATPSIVTGKLFPTGVGYSDDDNDNVTNFSDGQLSDMIP
jgi:prepilin-type N-terminal cleavage/methylation domain-containing protein